MQRRDKIILEKVVKEIDIALELAEGMSLDAFLADERTKRAASMTLINIGELVKHITEETRLANAHMAWKDAAGMRDMAAHKYQTLRMEDVYNTIAIDLPLLKEQVGELLKDSNAENCGDG